MKASKEVGSRTIKFSELPGKVSSVTELEVSLMYRVNGLCMSRCSAAVSLDNEVIPGILRAVNGIRSIVLVVRKWYKKSCGYHLQSCQIIVDGKNVGSLARCDNPQHDALDYLADKNFIQNLTPGSPWEYCENNGIALRTVTNIVARKSDL